MDTDLGPAKQIWELHDSSTGEPGNETWLNEVGKPYRNNVWSFCSDRRRTAAASSIARQRTRRNFYGGDRPETIVRDSVVAWTPKPEK